MSIYVNIVQDVQIFEAQGLGECIDSMLTFPRDAYYLAPYVSLQLCSMRPLEQVFEV